ncbi:unnamed protein product [Eruca vesicaria subsp. sativa]|uniref:Uncharacterized protein n=1 Tax=Eruca vesicaria subsp. sativa TaxID=29727 RepID=A0ABC8LHC8_ERUVS|nr:unnamed protein product [Eruca vesicaria subsp. sativa]
MVDSHICRWRGVWRDDEACGKFDFNWSRLLEPCMQFPEIFFAHRFSCLRDGGVDWAHAPGSFVFLSVVYRFPWWRVRSWSCGLSLTGGGPSLRWRKKPYLVLRGGACLARKVSCLVNRSFPPSAARVKRNSSQPELLYLDSLVEPPSFLLAGPSCDVTVGSGSLGLGIPASIPCGLSLLAM